MFKILFKTMLVF